MEDKVKIQEALDRTRTWFDFDRPFLEIVVLPESAPCYLISADEPVSPYMDMCKRYSFRQEEYQLKILEEVLVSRWLRRVKVWLKALASWPSIHRVSRQWYRSYHHGDFEYISIVIYLYEKVHVEEFDAVAKSIYEEERTIRVLEIVGNSTNFEGAFFDETKTE